jgi:prepilin-type N-terminal cleavage/methylation domain-containing protein
MLLASFHLHKKPYHPLGFGLVELMVSISIMALIMAVVFTRQDAFNSAILLRSQAYEIALELREIQLYAVSATTINEEYRQQLGVTFSVSQPNLYQIEQHAIDAVTGDILNSEPFGAQGTVDNRFAISEVRADGAVLGDDTVVIIFERPDFDASFFDSNGVNLNASNVEIDVNRVDSSDKKTIEITSAGQISVQ